MQGIGLQDLARLRIDSSRNQHLALFLACRHRHHHRLSRRGRSVIHRGVADVHARQFGHHTLVLKDIMKSTLRNLCLIRRIAGQELRARQQGRNHRRGIVVVDTIACETRQLTVLLTKLLKELAHLHLTHRQRQLVVAPETDGLWNLGIEFIETLHARCRQHRLQVIFGMGEILIHYLCMPPKLGGWGSEQAFIRSFLYCYSWSLRLFRPL